MILREFTALEITFPVAFAHTTDVAFVIKLPMLEWRKINFIVTVCGIFQSFFATRSQWYVFKSHHTEYEIFLAHLFVIYFKFFSRKFFPSSYYCCFVCLFAEPNSTVSFSFCYSSYVDFSQVRYYEIIESIFWFDVAAIGIFTKVYFFE